MRVAQRKLGNFKRRVLKEHFGQMISVREFTKRGRPHFHILIDCLGDVSSGFDWEHYQRVQAWRRNGSIGAKPPGRLCRTPLLVKLHNLLRERVESYGFGKVVELVPIRFPERVGFYLGGYLSKSIAHKPDDAKGTRAVNYSAKCPRIFRGQWAWNSVGAWLWRAKLKAWAAKHDCHNFPQLAALFGPRWAYHHREAILATVVPEYPTEAHARADGITGLPDTAIRIGPRRLWVDGVEVIAKEPPQKIRHASWDQPATVEPRKYQLSSVERPWRYAWSQEREFALYDTRKTDRKNHVL